VCAEVPVEVVVAALEVGEKGDAVSTRRFSLHKWRMGREENVPAFQTRQLLLSDGIKTVVAESATRRGVSKVERRKREETNDMLA
jgi:hypothetical protein